ncbi:YdcH family protein [Mesorhizobium sp. CC13]|uniref:YdcH family protein n=1 Tax=Mesorhizobium sp. CC13 TaxID=3029194 RepID=UPI003267A4C2
MSNTPHTLGEEFPGKLEAIHALKAQDETFARALAEYDEVNDRIHRAETRIEPVSADHEASLRKRRLVLKDAIATALAAN